MGITISEVFGIKNKFDKQYAYDMGYDCGFNSPTEKNCDCWIFHCEENTKAWERGKKDGEEKRKQSAKN